MLFSILYAIHIVSLSLSQTQTQIIEPVVDQSHLTQVQIGFDTQNPLSTMFQSEDQQIEEEEEDILTQVDEATEILKETMIDNVPAEVRCVLV